MFYVYEWYIVETDEVIYVGKGTRNRYKVRKHNKFFNEMLKRYKCESRIIKEFSTEKEAFSYEFDRVKELKAKGQCVCNIYEGGFGGTVNWWNDDRKEWYSDHNTMKSENQRKRMEVDNPMKNSDTAKKVNSKKKIPVIIGETQYESIKDASEKLNVSTSTITGWCIRGKTTDGTTCMYANERTVSYQHKNDGQKRAVYYKGKRYESSTALGIEIGVAQTTASRWCRQGRDSFGNPCRYVDDTRKETDKNIRQKSISVIVNGVWYPSKEHASRAIGLSSYEITQLLNGKKHSAQYICEYGNQQPSRGNVDNSTSEGSTTNR